MDLSSDFKQPGAQPVEPPSSLVSQVQAFESALRERGVRGALWFLNARTPHRFTGIFRFDGEMLRSVALVDKWDPLVELGEDLPVASAYCAHLRAAGEPLEVEHGPSDTRVPWMTSSPVVSYCGAPICDESGGAWGALCHFDNAPCDAKNSDMPLLIAAAALIYRAATQASR